MNLRYMAQLLGALAGSTQYDRRMAAAAARAAGYNRVRLGTAHEHGRHHRHPRRKNPVPGHLKAMSRAKGIKLSA